MGPGGSKLDEIAFPGISDAFQAQFRRMPKIPGLVDDMIDQIARMVGTRLDAEPAVIIFLKELKDLLVEYNPVHIANLPEYGLEFRL